MLIAGFQKSTLLDYPGKLAAMVFTYGCNLRCEYCHNPELVTQPCTKERLFSEKEIYDHLKKRMGLLDALVITGGEPTIQKDLEAFIVKLKEINLLIKLDTNGTKPDVVERLIKKGLVDYWAMDVKYEEEMYRQVLQEQINYENIKQSISLIMGSGKDYEFRTTYVKGIHSPASAKKIGKLIKGAKVYYIQNFRPGKTIKPDMNRTNSFTQKELQKIKEAISPFVEHVEIRE